VIRIGASPIILRDHLPAIEKQVRRKFPMLRLLLREGNERQLLRDVEHDDLDLAISLKPEQPPLKVNVQLLGLSLTPVLLVPKTHKARRADEILRSDPGDRLIALPPDELLMRHFAEQLKEDDIIWRPWIEVTSLELIQHFVLRGYGVGLSISRPEAVLSSGLRELPLVDFPKVELALLYRDYGKMPLFESFIEEINRYVTRLKRSKRYRIST
jgi:DNA-binding transcriptional LysR family regulator